MKPRNMSSSILSCVPVGFRHRFVFLLLTTLAKLAVADGDFFNFEGEWFGLVRYLLAASFVIFGVHALLYTDLLMQYLLTGYLETGTGRRVLGDVLSCDSKPGSNGAKFDVGVLYVMPVHKHADDPRGKFRHPEKVVVKRFLRSFELDRPLPRGKDAVEVLVLVGYPRSGMLRDVVEHEISKFSYVRLVLILVPGLALVSLAVWSAVRQVRDGLGGSAVGWCALGIWLWLSVFLSIAWCRSRLSKRKGKFVYAAKAMVVSNWGVGHQQQSFPLSSSQQQPPPPEQQEEAPPPRHQPLGVGYTEALIANPKSAR